MRARVGPLRLSHRIVASVALGLALILLLFGLVALWTIRESTRAAYYERVTLAQALSRWVDDALRYGLMTLEREAAYLVLTPGHPLGEDERQRLADLRSRLGFFALLSLTDAKGTTLWTDPSRVDVTIGDPLQHPAVQLVLRTGEPQVTEFLATTDREAVYACLAVPVRDVSGRLTGALMAEVDPGHPALSLVPAAEAGDGMHVQLLDRAGRLLAGSKGYDVSGAPQHQALLADLMESRTAGYRIHQPAPAMGVPSHLVAYAPVSLLPTWGIVVEQPRDAVLAIPRRLQQRLVVFGAAALVLASAVAWFDVQRVVRPLQHLTDVAGRFAAGQLDEPVHLDRRDELGVLAQALETMRQRLHASLQEVAKWNRELERRVEQRTQELQAIATENARLLAEVQRKEAQRRQLLEKSLWAQEEERKRVARELHDEIGQGLTALVMGLASIEEGLPAGEARQRLADLRELTSSTLAEVRRIMLDLRPSLLDDLGLPAAIGWYLERHLAGTRIQHEVRLVGLGTQERLPPEVETTLFRVIQEAVTNTLKHARARSLQVELHRQAQEVLAYIRDDGCGFDPSAVVADPAHSHGLGLLGMEERVALVGGSFRIVSRPGQGTCIQVRVPLNTAEAA